MATPRNRGMGGDTYAGVGSASEMMSDGTARYPIRFGSWYGVLSSALRLRPADSYVEVRGDEVECRMGWAFRARFPRSAVVRAARLDRKVLSRGVHGFGGQWLVNGAGAPILAITLDPPQRARVVGLSLRLRELLVSVDDPEALATQLTKQR